MNKEEYILLYEKCAAGNCTKIEQKLLEQVRDEFSLESGKWDEDRFGNEQDYIDALYTQLHHDIHRETKVKRFRYLGIAASIALLCALSILLYINTKKPVLQKAQLAVAPAKIEPARNKAVLTLGNGRHIILDDANKGDLTVQGNVKAIKANDGQLVYTMKEGDKSVVQPADILNILEVPKGGKYQVILPDGTRVWLNSASSLEYPVAFSGKERRVTLTGEAYFEVAKNKDMPFTIKVDQTEVRVLGTHFNVNSYEPDNIKTSLLEGSVLLSNLKDQQLLKPGEAGICTSDGMISKTHFDADVDLDWKRGYFVYHDENIRSIMEEAGRWYNIEVEYRGNLKDKKFWGKVSRSADIEEFLKSLELTGSVHFKIEGRKVIVMS